MNPPRFRRQRRKPKQFDLAALEHALIPHKVKVPPDPPERNRNPAIRKVVRGAYTLVSGTTTNITAGSIALDDAADYLGGTPETPRYKTMRIERIHIWGPFLAFGDTTTPTQSMQVSIPNYGPGASVNVLNLEDSVSAGQTNRRACVGATYGAGMTYTVDTTTSSVVAAIAGTSMPGVYTVDTYVIFQ